MCFTKEKIIEKFVSINGDKYDYSSVEYVNMSTPVVIRCKIHGPFKKRPDKHLIAQGCQECSEIERRNKRRLPLHVFLKRAKEKHGNKYNYSKVMYENVGDVITIGCPTHGDFPQILSNHIRRGDGCKKCSGVEVFDTDSFISKSIIIHGEKYKYDKVVYLRSSQKVIITCKEHGDFPQKPNGHLQGLGCDKCGLIKNGLSRRSNTDEFIRKSIEKHGEKYEYDKVEYIKSNKKVTIVCKQHGEFSITPNDHLSGKIGCGKCYHEIFDLESFKEKSNKIHLNFYDYSKSIFNGCGEKLIIICPSHGEFRQTPTAHTTNRGSGCPICKKSKGVREIIRVLNEMGEKYSLEKRFKECRKERALPFDIYLKRKEPIIIEYDGIQHYKPKWGEEQLELTKMNDKIKNDFCNKNNFKLIRIPYFLFEHIEEILRFHLK